MANQPSTIPAPQSSAVSLDQEDIDEMMAHLSNLENIADNQALITLELKLRASESDQLCQAMRVMAKRMRTMIAERAAATSVTP